ncbi:MAG: hypothetical protein DHS20C11_35250 [Lysobacteraceae bacterium]|nr:MAG: hypothetical protein DHS20C11_35250 [Xanthomonadaceae bacterium]
MYQDPACANRRFAQCRIIDDALSSEGAKAILQARKLTTVGAIGLCKYAIAKTVTRAKKHRRKEGTLARLQTKQAFHKRTPFA